MLFEDQRFPSVRASTDHDERESYHIVKSNNSEKEQTEKRYINIRYCLSTSEENK
jgi:hypothetical protein